MEKNGEELTVTEALGEYYSPIEEGKADIPGLYEVPYLLDEGILADMVVGHQLGEVDEAGG